jgi:hypothetical protein
MWWLYASRAAPAWARSLCCCPRFVSRVNRNVVDRDKGTPVWETSTRLGFSTAASLGTALMVPDTTDKAAVANGKHPVSGCARFLPTDEPGSATRSHKPMSGRSFGCHNAVVTDPRWTMLNELKPVLIEAFGGDGVVRVEYVSAFPDQDDAWCGLVRLRTLSVMVWRLATSSLLFGMSCEEWDSTPA